VAPKPLASLKNQFKVVLLDLYLCWCKDPDPCLGLSLSNGTFAANSRYNALHISKRISLYKYCDAHQTACSAMSSGRSLEVDEPALAIQ
jgi:hypothetical protein